MQLAKLKYFLGGILSLAVLAGALRVIPLGGESLVGDELFSRYVAMASFGDATRVAMQDIAHPPLYYFALGLWSRVFGTGPYGLRSLSLLFGVVTVGLTGLLGWSLFRDTRIALLATTLVALSDIQVYFSQEVRSYAMYSTLVLMLLLMLWQALRRPEKVSYWLAFAGISATLVCTHYVGWLYVMSTTPGVLMASARRGFIRWAASLSVSGTAFIIWLALVLRNAPDRTLKAHLGWIEHPSFYDIAATYADFNGLPNVDRGTTLSLIVGAVLLGSCGHALISGTGRIRAGERLGGLVLLAGPALLPPVLLFGLASLPLEFSTWGARHLLPSQALWALLVSFGLFHLARGRGAVIALGVFTLVALQLAPTVENMQYSRRTPYHLVAEFLRRETVPGEVIFTTDSHNVGAPVNYYLGKEVVLALPATNDHLPDSFWLLYRPALSSNRHRVMELRTAGWKIDRQDYFGRRPGHMWGTKVVLLDR